MLLRYETGSYLYARKHNLDKAMSAIEQLLVAVHNRIVDGIPVDKKDVQAKKKAKLEFPKTIVKKKIISREQAERRLAFSKVAKE
jgi:hypothetical protein